MKIGNGYSIESIMNQIRNNQVQSSDNPFDNTIEETEEMIVKTGETIEQTELIQTLDSMGIEVTQSELQEIETFMAEGEGTEAEKLETIKVAKEYGIDITPENLTAINAALHEPMAEVQLPNKIFEGKVSAEKLDRFMKLLNVPTEIKEQAQSLLEAGDVKGALMMVLESVQPDGLTTEVLNAEGMTEEDILFKIIDTIKGQDLPVMTFPEEDSMIFELNDLLLETEEVEEISLLDNLEEIIDQVIQEIVTQQLPLESLIDTPTMKQYLVTETTDKMIEVKEDFSAFQKETIESLRPFVEGETITKSDLEQVMTKAIDKLDAVLMKSDIPLYTSMKDEKKLILMSSDLQVAKKMVMKGEFAEAKNIMKQVSTSLNNMVFTPQKRHVQGFVKDIAQLTLSSEDFYYKKDDVAMGARGVHEYLKGLGLNYDSEVAEKILGPMEEKPPIKDNLKQVLLALKETFEKEEDEKLTTVVEKNLSNLNGQQLLNKEPQKNQEQTLHLNIPIVLADEMKDLKLFVQSRDANNKMDWENCTLYFAVDTGKYGKTGIRIKVQNRMTQVQVINDHQEFKEKVGPLIEDMFKNLMDVGYVKGDTQYRSDEDEKEASDLRQVSRNMQLQKGYEVSEKGLDIKI